MPSLSSFLRDAESLHALFDEEGRNSARAQLGFALGIDHQGVGVRPVGDPHLVAIEQVVAALVFCTQLHAQHVAAGTRLAHGQCTDMLTGDQFGQVFGALLGRAVAPDLVDA
jgi:hypothetical protein